MNLIIRRIFFLAIIALCSNLAIAQSQMESYVIQSGETLYSISRSHGITVDDILKANPGLTESIMAGQTINIPSVSSNPQVQHLNPCKTTHKVAKKETVYSISQMYGLTADELIAANPGIRPEKLKKGSELCIPYSASEKKSHIESQSQVLETIETKRQESLIKYYDVLKIAVIAPFALNETRRSVDAQKMTDFYKGFLMAVDTLKHQGISTEIYAYEEIGTDGVAIQNVLSQPMLKHVNLIIGPFRPANAAKVASFASENKITMVTPMSTKSYDFSNYRNVFQVSSPQRIVYDQVCRKFADRFASQNVVFVAMNDSRNNNELTNRLKQTLQSNNQGFKTISIDDITTIREQLSDTKSNLLVPSSPSEKALKTLAQKLRNRGSELEDVRISLFGYPEWQTYTSSTDILRKYNATFYSTFFANPQNANIQRFDRNFTHWFNREQVKSYPKYGVLGFDIGQYFIRGLHEKGSAFSANTNVRYQGMQMPFRFEKKSEDGAAYNHSVMLIRVNSDGTYSVDR